MKVEEKTANKEYLRKSLESLGVNLTQQRRAVYDYLSQVEHHPTADDVFLAVKQKLPKISLATVYKNLEALVTCGAVSKWTYGDAAARYDIRTDHHYHTRCLKCGKLSDLDVKGNGELLENIKPNEDFVVKDYRLELLGYCQKCQ